MKVVALVSGGKDSCFAMMRCIDYGHQIVALANLVPDDDSVDELDSHMYQTVGHQIITKYAECMALPLFRRRIKGCRTHSSLNYLATPGDEVEDMFLLLQEVKRKIPSVAAVSSGAIASDYQRLRVESVCSRLGLVSLAFLWKQDQTLLLDEMLSRGIEAILVKVAALGLNPAKHLGQQLSDVKSHLHHLSESYGINVCGEGGEYETLTLNCPLFHTRIVLDDSEVILHSLDSSIAPVGILRPTTFHLEQNNNMHAEELCYVYNVEDDFITTDTPNFSSSDLACAPIPSMDVDMHISKTGKDIFSIGCWASKSSDDAEGLQKDLTAVLSKIEGWLSEDGLGWANVLYIHLYISDMGQFSSANSVYEKFIMQKKCHLGVPSRSTVELPLLVAGLGSAYVEALVAVTDKPAKRVLHVQSMSCWAPSCIGPYSQATLHDDILHMAGQLGLDPPTMTLIPGGPCSQLDRALANSEAVANCFGGSIFSLTVTLVVYCSADLDVGERIKLEDKIQSSFLCHFDGSVGDQRPVLLYVLAYLPKSAYVELKPLLHIPGGSADRTEMEQHESEDSTSESQPTSWKQLQKSIYSELLNGCSQIHFVPEKMISALVSVTNDLEAKIWSASKSTSSMSLQSSPKPHLKHIAAFCIFSLADILSTHHFHWTDLSVLRFYYSVTALPVGADVISDALSEAAFVLDGVRLVHGTFNVVPVRASGRTMRMEDIVTCEIFASKRRSW